MTGEPAPGRAAVLAVGDELLEGGRHEANGPAIAERLAGLGIELATIRVERDDEERIATSLLELAREHAFVFVSGGLGPTLDDVTRHAVARAAGVELVLSEDALVEVASHWRERDEEMPAANRRQALLPAGSTRLWNRVGTAPGFRLALGDATLFALPGPPHELSAMVEDAVLPWLRAAVAGRGAAEIERAAFHLFGLSESVFADRVGAWMERGANPEMAVTAGRGVLSVRLLARAATRAEAAALLAERADAFRERFREHLFSETSPDLGAATARVLLERGIPVATAESCTGGLVAGRLTEVPGISAIFSDGFVTQAELDTTAADYDLLSPEGDLNLGTGDTTTAEKLDVTFAPPKGESATLSAEGNIRIGAKLAGEGASVISGGTLKVIGAGANLAATPNAEEGVNMYARGDITLSTLKEKNDGSYEFKDIKLKGLVYTWGDFKAKLGSQDPDVKWGKMALEGTLVAYGGDPANGKPTNTSKGLVNITAEQIKLKFDPAYLLGVMKSLPDNVQFERASWTAYR